MTVSDIRAETWKAIPGVQWWYEASDRGRIRSLDHTSNGREFEGRVLAPRQDGDGYLVVNVTLVNGARKHGASVARLVLLAHAGEPDDPGMQACHGPGGQRDNRYPENLRWDTDEANREDWRRDNPPRPKPVKVCVRCGAGFDTSGRRCHPCVMWTGQQGAQLLAGGKDPEEAAQVLDYPSAVGLFRLAKKYGGLRCVITPVLVHDEVNAAAPGNSPSWLRRVKMRAEAWLADSDAP